MERERNVMLSNSVCACVSSLDQDNRGVIEEKSMGFFLHLFEGGQWNLAID